MKNILARIANVFGSFGLACVILTLLLVLTFVGTFEQKWRSIYDVQIEYFESAIVIYDRLGVPIPLPGAYLLLSLLFVNLVVGGMIRIRKNKSTLGILITHLGIAFLLLGGLIEFQWSTKGRMAIRPGETSDEYESYYEWEVVVIEHRDDGSVTEHIIPHEHFADLDADEQARFTSEALPFGVVLSGFLPHCTPVPADSAEGRGAVDGFYLRSLPKLQKAEYHDAGVFVAVEEAGGARQRGLLWAQQTLPFPLEVGGRRFEIDLRHRRWQLPFAVRLDEFVYRKHPRTEMPLEFSSHVKKIRGGVVEGVHITMNEPLRHNDGNFFSFENYVLFQSSWFPQGRVPPGTRLGSVFSVVRNPADRIPLWACVVIAIGLGYHFSRKLKKHIGSETRRRA